MTNLALGDGRFDEGARISLYVKLVKLQCIQIGIDTVQCVGFILEGVVSRVWVTVGDGNSTPIYTCA